jgi:hypothetical protein
MNINYVKLKAEYRDTYVSDLIKIRVIVKQVIIKE